MTITIPFWGILIILVLVAIIGAVIIGMMSGDYNFFTPLLAVGWFMVFIVAAIAMALGKYVF